MRRRAFAVTLAVAVVGCGDGEPERGPTVRAERGRIERVVVATGTIEPENEVEVRPRVAGIVESLHVEAGDVVEQGKGLTR